MKDKKSVKLAGYAHGRHAEALAVLERTLTDMDCVRSLSGRALMEYCKCRLLQLSGAPSAVNLSRAVFCHAYQKAAKQAGFKRGSVGDLQKMLGLSVGHIWSLIRVGAKISGLRAAGLSVISVLSEQNLKLSTLDRTDWQLEVLRKAGIRESRPAPATAAQAGSGLPLLESVLAELKAVHALLDKLV